MSSDLPLPLTRNDVMVRLKEISAEIVHCNSGRALELIVELQTYLAEDIALDERIELVSELGWSPESVHH